MAPLEIVDRTRDAILRRIWQRQRITRGANVAMQIAPNGCSFAGQLPPLDRTALPQHAIDRLLTAAQALLDGRWLIFERPHPGLGRNPDWFVDALSGRHAPADDYAFDIPYRDEDRVGNIKYIWESSRHHHLTMLAAAYAMSGDERYARRIADHLQSWWRENPFLTGPNWISGIEIGLRLVAWVWIRRLLRDWPGAAALFEDNPQFFDQLYHHQRWLSSFPSRGSSANNHVIAEAAGQFVAACAFPCFKKSARWRARSADILRREITTQTFPSGLNRELATDYQGLVLELYLAAAIEGELSGWSLGPGTWERIRAMTDALAAIVDAAGRPPRQGDSDGGIGLLLDAPKYHRWRALLATGRHLFGALPWWPESAEHDLRTVLWTLGITSPSLPPTRAPVRPDLFADAGHVYLRDAHAEKEIWCRCDHGPHGFLSIAAHAHADALSIELRVGGVDVLADPGTYCYHGEPAWRTYFRSTLGHNTLELFAQDQSISGGPFLWTHHAQSKCLVVEGLDQDAPQAIWAAEHSGYVGRGGPVHRRTVVLDRTKRIVTITDEIRGGRASIAPGRLALHLGPDVACRLASARAKLTWPGGDADFALPEGLNWTAHRGETNPPLGWYSPSFGVKVPSCTLIGAGDIREGFPLTSRLRIS
jgi:hypothetical protein